MNHISATEQAWNSATTLYIARKVQALAAGRTLTILDMGCGEGQIIRSLIPYGHELFGYELPSHARAAALGSLFGHQLADRIRFMDDERVIPFEGARFDVVYANQVFEHVRFLQPMIAECARVLKPGGSLVTLFPLATYPIEGHVRIPFAHWIPAGHVRRAYLRAHLTLGVGRRLPGLSIAEASREWDDRLRQFTFYRFMNEVEMLLDFYFEEWHVDTGSYIRAKTDLLSASSRLSRRLMGRFLSRATGRWLEACVTYGFNAVFCASRPRQSGSHPRAKPWREDRGGV